jgi:hypothetical protein
MIEIKQVCLFSPHGSDLVYEEENGCFTLGAPSFSDSEHMNNKKGKSLILIYLSPKNKRYTCNPMNNKFENI